MVDALKKQRAELTGDYEKDKQANKKEQREAFIDKSFEKAKAKMTEKEMGKGLDFDTVWKACQKVIEKEPGYKAVISSSKNPGAKAYEIGLLDPDIAKLAALQKKNFPDQKKKQKVGLDGGDTPAQFFSQERVSKMERPEIEANLPAIRLSQKKWKK